MGNIKLAVVAVLVLGSLATVVAMAFMGNLSYAVTVAEYHEDAEKYEKYGLRVEGALTPATHNIKQTVNGAEHTFRIHDKENDALGIDVLFVGPVPDTMRDEGDVMVEGRINESGILEASKVTPKCASKYDETLDEAYRNGTASYESTR